jgi:hypothetical protein
VATTQKYPCHNTAIRISAKVDESHILVGSTEECREAWSA